MSSKHKNKRNDDGFCREIEMMKDLEKAKELLLSGAYTCVLCRDKEIVTSRLRGVKPLVAWYETKQNLNGYSAADKVVGKATAFLYVLLEVKAVYAGVISRSAFQVLDKYNVKIKYGELVDNIINRQGDGICPFEFAVLGIENPTTAYEAILKKMREMNITI